MDTYKEQFQEYAFNVLREYPLDKTAVNVLSALVNSNMLSEVRIMNF